jgi:hypothetical protein
MILALAGAGCGPGGSQAGQPTSPGGLAGSPAVSSLTPTAQLSAVGWASSANGLDKPVYASASQAAARPAPWYATAGTPDLGVDTSQDYRTAVVGFTNGGQPAGEVALDASGTRTTLMNVSPDYSGYFISGDGQWLVLVPGASVADPVTQVYRLSGTRSLPITFSIPPQAGSVQQSGSGILGFTKSDQLLVLNDSQQLWAVSVDGKTASQVAAGSFGGGLVDEVVGTAQAGLIAMRVDTYDQDGVPAFSTELLSGTGSMIHTFPDGSPLIFSPDGKYVLIDQSTATSDPDQPAPEEVCDVITFSCVPTPGQAQSTWLPNGDLEVDSNSSSGSASPTWWNAETGSAGTEPASFRSFTPNQILPTAIMNRVATTRPPQTLYTGGD